MPGGVSAADNRSAVDDRLPGVMAEIRSLLDLPAGAELPPRADVEDTLTSGYAYALVLERDRLRLERELRALVRSSERADQRKLDGALRPPRRGRSGARGRPRAALDAARAGAAS